MKNLLSVSAALLATTTVASAGGIERSGNPYAILFEDGNYVELSFSKVTPDVSGEYPGGVVGTGSTGNMAEDYMTFGVGVKYDLNEQLSFGLFLNQPYGADALYPDGLYTGLGADWDSTQIAAVAKYQVNPNVSVYGGVRSVESEASITINDGLLRLGALAEVARQGEGLAAQQAALEAQALEATTIEELTAIAAAGEELAAAGAALQAAAAEIEGAPEGTFEYNAVTEPDRQTSYILGAAYERPDIALRIALTYESGFTHTFATTETLPAFPGANGNSETEIEMPQSVTLDFQSGVAVDTLVFGSIKWSEWSVWEVRPVGYELYTDGDAVTGIDEDVWTYRLGVGRRINDQLSVFGRVTYEAADDEEGVEVSRLAPTNGSLAVGFGGTYTVDNTKVTAGVEYVTFGDGDDSLGVEFADNSAIGVGVSVGFSF